SFHRFFEVELRKVVRIKNDILLNPEIVSAYLAQVAPVPFRPDFGFAPTIDDFLRSRGVREPIEISINGESSVHRPFPQTFEVTKSINDRFSSVRFIEVPGINGGTDAIGWLLDHGYYGAIPRRLGIGGLRLRSGDLQVGGDDILAEHFVEPRFNAWVVG